MPISNISSTVLKNLQVMFKIGFKKPSKNGNVSTDFSKNIYPLEVDHNEKGDLIVKKVNLESETEKLFQRWMSDTHFSQEQYKNREWLFNEMDSMYDNCSIISRSVELMTDETLQCDSNDVPVKIEGRRKVKKFISKFFDDINLFDLLRPTIIDYILKGNAGWLLGFDSKGVNKIIPIDPYNIHDRIEFTPHEIKERLSSSDPFIREYKGLDRVNELINSIVDKDSNTISYFDSYLLGFQISDRVVPPWRFIHFRNMTNKSAFKPYGVPMFIHSLAAFKQYDAAMTLQVTAKALIFPKIKYEVNLPNSLNPIEKVEKATEFLNMLQNSGFNSSKKEQPGIGDIIVTIKDLFDVSAISQEVNLGRLDDVQMLRDDLIVSTMLPPRLLDPKDSGFGVSGVSLIQEWKPFARTVYRIQNAFLQNLSQLVKIHMIYSGEFEMDEIDFVLSMPYPESQTNNDLITSQNSLLSLANDIIGSIQDKITGGEKLPPELVKSIYRQFLPYDDVRVDTWVDEALKAKQADETTPTQDSVDGDPDNIVPTNELNNFNDNTDNLVDNLDSINNNSTMTPEQKVEEKRKVIEKYKQKKAKLKSVLLNEEMKANNSWKKLEEKLGKKNLKEQVEDIIFENKQDSLREGVLGERHYYSSRNKHIDFRAEDLREYDKNRLEKIRLKEEVNKSYFAEEVKYTLNLKDEESRDNQQEG